MKNLMVVIAFCMASSAYACPNLAGNYVCNVNGEVLPSSVTMVDGFAAPAYQITQDNSAWSPLISDGVERDFTGISAMEQGRYSATCEGDAALVVNAKGKVVSDGQPIGDLALVVRAYLDAAGNLMQNINGTLTVDGTAYPMDERNDMCVRQ